MNSNIIYVLQLLTALIVIKHAGTDDCSASYNSYYYSAGDVYITGFFNAHKGSNCSLIVSSGLQQMTNLVIVTEILNNLHYIPGIKIGTILYDLCAMKDTANKALISSIFDKNCKPSNNLGIITTKGIYEDLKNLSTALSIPIFELFPSADMNLFFKISIQLLIELRCTIIDLLLVPTMQISSHFIKTLTEEGICVKQSRISWPFESLCMDGKSVIVMIGMMKEVRSLASKININCTNRFIVGLIDDEVDLEKFFGEIYLNDAYVIVSSSAWVEPEIAIEAEAGVDAIVRSLSNVAVETSHYANVTLDLLQMASTELAILDLFKNSSSCLPNATTADDSTTSLPTDCPIYYSLPATSLDPLELNRHRIGRIVDVLELNEKTVLSYVVLKYELNDVACFAETRLSGREWVLEFNFGLGKNLEQGRPTLCDFNGSSSPSPAVCANCSNARLLSLFSFPSATENGTAADLKRFPFVWKTDVWVPAVVTLIVIGIVCCVAVLAFLVSRMCKQDVLEGNPCTTVLLAFAVIFMYVTVLPFCVVARNTVVDYSLQPDYYYYYYYCETLYCAFRLVGPQLSYSFVFGLLLSRSVMILTCDFDGSFMSHINGYLHAFLCFFMVAVQLALSGQFIVLNWYLLREDYCPEMSSGNLFLLNQGYNGFLLLCLVCVVPFVTRSKRNYKEGVCFALVGICSLPTWIAWCGLYVLSSSVWWKDFSVAFGLCGTATAVVLCVFIPRSYLLMSGVIRDQIASALPSLSGGIGNASGAVSGAALDVKYRSNQALYDSVNVETIPKGRSTPAGTARGKLNLGYYYNDRNSHLGSNFDLSTGENKSPDGTAEFSYLQTEAAGTSSSKVTRF